MLIDTAFVVVHDSVTAPPGDTVCGEAENVKVIGSGHRDVHLLRNRLSAYRAVGRNRETNIGAQRAHLLRS